MWGKGEHELDSGLLESFFYASCTVYIRLFESRAHSGVLASHCLRLILFTVKSNRNHMKLRKRKENCPAKGRSKIRLDSH